MILFRKEYKQANDNIKVDQELLEKTLDRAFNQKPVRKIYACRPMTSVAAAVVLVIGCSVAYPRLMAKPVIEHNEPVITIAPVGDELIAAPDVTAQPEQKQPEKPKETLKPVQKPATTQEPAQVVVPVETLEITIPAAEPEQQEVDVPSVARFIVEPPSNDGIEHQLNLADGYVLQSAENESYIFENGDGKVFSVTVTESLELPEDTENDIVWTENENQLSLKFNKDDKGYTVETETVSKAELTEIFEEFITEN